MIYLKKVDDKVLAYGDEVSLETSGGVYDIAVTEEQWAACDCHAFILDGRIILGLSKEEEHELALAKAKADRAAAVAAITVEVDGMTFDGNEKAQERMARAVSMAESPGETTEWVLADNTVAIVTAAQLRRACKMAGKTQTRLWIKPYQN